MNDNTGLGGVPKMENNQETAFMWIKNVLVWIGVLISGITSSQVMTWRTIALAASSLYLNILKIRQHKRGNPAQEA